MATLTKSTGTVTLTGAAEKVTLPAVYGWVWLKNMSDSDIFAGLSADISEGADGVMTIPAGECGRLQTDGFCSIYLLGTGNALVVAQNYADCPFKAGGKGGESPDLSEYAKKSDIPTELPADGGNADTVNGHTVDADVPADAVFTDTIPDLTPYALKSKYGDTTIDVGRKAGTTVGIRSTAEGYNTTASAQSSHAEGDITTASAQSSHAEGYNTTASGNASHAEGRETTASGQDSHAEGQHTTASGYCSHAGGANTNALHDFEVAYGNYNQSNSDTLFSIGDGTSDTARHNAFEITTTGGMLHDKDIAVKDDIINPNLLINPDFKINQRGNTSVVSSYSGSYCVDRWRVNGTCTQTSSGVTVSSSGSSYGYGTYYQSMENIPLGTLSLSTKCYEKIFSLTCIDASEAKSAELHITNSNGTDVGYLHTLNSGDKYSIEFIINSGCEIQIDWVKLEYGSIATPFVSPEPITELLKCQRYYQIHSTNNISTVDLRPNMRDGVVPTITALPDGNYSYSADL